MIHSVLIFVSNVRLDLASFFGIWVSSCLRNICWKGYPFSIDLFWYLCWKSTSFVTKHLFLDTQFHFIYLCIFSLSQYHTVLITVNLKQILKSERVSPPNLFFSRLFRLFSILELPHGLSHIFLFLVVAFFFLLREDSLKFLVRPV